MQTRRGTDGKLLTRTKTALAAKSKQMASVRTRGTAPELAVRRAIRTLGYRLNSNSPNLPGRPDVVVPSLQVAVFVHGCFWHRHSLCPKSAAPIRNQTFWFNKISENVKRDARKNVNLRQLGWRVITIWECHTKDPVLLQKMVQARFLRAMRTASR